MPASNSMALEAAAQTLAVLPLSTKPQEGVIYTCNGGDMQLALVTPPKSSIKLRTRGIVKYTEDVDDTSPPKGAGKTSWSVKDTLDLIDAVKTVEDNQLLADPVGRLSKAGNRIFKGNKWEQVAAILPNCAMSSSERFKEICRGKFQELRRTYQGMLRNISGHKFMSEEVCQKMKDYVDEVPPLRFFEGLEDSRKPKLIASGCTSLTPKTKCIEDIQDLQKVGKSTDVEKNCSESDQQQVRRSCRTLKRSCYLESYSDQDEMMAAPPKFTPPESRSSRNFREMAPMKEKVQRNSQKRARPEDPEDLNEQQVENINELFKKNFDLLRSSIDSTTENHLHKHLHKHFKVFENRMTVLIQKMDQKMDQKIDRLDQKFEEKMKSFNLPF